MKVKNRLKNWLVDAVKTEVREIRLRPIGYVMGVFIIFGWITIIQLHPQVLNIGGLFWGQGNFIVLTFIGIITYVIKDAVVPRVSRRGDAKYIDLSGEKYYMVPMSKGPYLKETWFALACKLDEEGLFRFYTGEVHESVVAEAKSKHSILGHLQETDTRTTIEELKAHAGARYNKIMAKMDPEMSKLLNLQMLVD